MSFCSSGQEQNNQYKYVDPLGNASTGGPQNRATIFNYLQGYYPKITAAGEKLASGLNTAAGNPGFQTAQNLAEDEMNGRYLAGSPQLDAAMAQNERTQLAAAGDADTRTRAMMARNGMAFSTANQQASQANRTAAAANAANTNAQTYLNNYQAERNNQNNAVNTLATATGTPLNYLAGISGAYLNPLLTAGNLVTGMTSGGQNLVSNQSGSYTPSVASDIMNGTSAVMGSF